MSDADDELRVDFGDLVQKLVLFDRVFLETMKLREFPVLIEKFGYDGVKALLDSDRIRIRYTGEAIFHMDGSEIDTHGFASLQLADRKSAIHEALEPINSAPGLTGKQPQKMRKLVADRLLTPPKDARREAWLQLVTDLGANDPVVRKAVALAASQRTGSPIDADALSLRIEQTADEGWHSESNLRDLLKIEQPEAHEIVSKGLVGVAGLNERIELMKRYNAVTGFRPNEMPLYEDKLNFLAHDANASAAEQRFQRVVEIAQLPPVDSDPSVHDVDLPRLLEILDSDEVYEFREWLRNVGKATDDEIADEIHKLRDKLTTVMHGKVGKAGRFSILTGVGLVPGGQLPALALGALDQFLFDKVIPEPGPTAFLSLLYPTIFQS